MGPFPHDAPPAKISAAKSRRHRRLRVRRVRASRARTNSRSCSQRMGYAPVARHKTKDITVWRQGDINYILNAEPGSHSRCASSTSTGPARRRWRGASSMPSMPSSTPSKGAEPYDGADKTLDVPAIVGIGGSLLYFVDALWRQGLGLRRRVRMARRARPEAGGRRLLLSRPPHPQRLSRQHGQVVRVLPRAVRLQADPLLRHRRQAHRAGQPRHHLALRQDPHPAQRIGRRHRARSRNICGSTRAKASSTSPSAPTTSTTATDALAANGLKFMPGPPDTYYEQIFRARERP